LNKIEIAMVRIGGNTHISARICSWAKRIAMTATFAALSVSSQTFAQVEWTTSLSPLPVDLPLTNQRAMSASDGATYLVALASDGESTRVRLARIASNGATQWVRWGTGSFAAIPQARPLPLYIHSDNSATIVYQDRFTNDMCVENFLVTGDSRSRHCYANPGASFKTALANDGDVYIASGNQRTVQKVSTGAIVRWSRTDVSYTQAVYTVGVDALGNYFELEGNRLRTWSSMDGTFVSDVLLAGTNLPVNSSSGNDLIARANRDAAAIRGVAFPGNAVVTNVARFDAAGALSWSKDIVFPGVGNTARVWLAAGDNDSVYVIRTPAADGDSQVAKLSPTGAVLWQRHYANVRRIVESATGLMAIRTDVSLTTSSNDSYIFPIAIADGALGVQIIYSRTDTSPPTEWFALNGGVLATFQSGTYTPSPTLLATSIFIGTATTNRWVGVAQSRPATFIDQVECLMPKLALSSPSIGWARTTTFASNGQGDWTRVTPATGTITARTAAPAPGCGAPITADGGRVIASPNGADRIKKIDAAGAPVWQTTSTANPQQYSGSPITSVASNDETTYVVGSLLGRASASGTILFETETTRGNARYLAVDSANNAWVVAQNASNQTVVSKTSAAGAQQWATVVDVPSCSDTLLSTRLITSNDMLVATQSCGEGRVFKINASGQIAWQRVVAGSAQLPNIELRAFNVDSAGNVYAGGCARDGSNPTTKGASLVASWTSAGSERWGAQTDLLGNAAECVSSIAIDSGDVIYAAVSSSDVSRAPLLWSFTASGVERWRHSGVLSSPFAASAELLADASGKLTVLGESPPNVFGPREATVRRINVSNLGSSLKLKFLDVPAASIGYREAFSVRIGMRTAADAVATATSITKVSLGLQTGTGNLDGSLTCTIAVGASDCTISDTRYDVVEAGVTLSAGGDGFATVVSSPIAFKMADTNTTIVAVTAAPYNAFSIVRIRAITQGPSPVVNQNASGNLNGPYSPVYPGIDNCTTVSLPGALSARECDLLVRSVAMPLNAQFSSYNGSYGNSTAAPTSLPVTRVATSLQITNDPANTNVVGDRLRFRVALLTPNGFNATQFVLASAVTVTGGSCGGLVAAGTLANKFIGSYLVCEVASATAGAFNANISFTGNGDLLAAGPSNQTVTLSAGAVLRGNASFPNGVTVCSPNPGITCGLVGTTNNEWQCSGPSGMSGQVFFVPSPSAGQYYFPTSPIPFNNIIGLKNYVDYVLFNGSTACNLDVDGDGARLLMTDGILVLRRMLGLTGDALIDGATHACVPRSAAGIAQAMSLPAYDIDGDGQPTAATDGLLLLRAMLGFRGTALISGAVGANATRRTAIDIQNFLSSSCGYFFN
jgi:hypothetical protein